MSGHRIIRHGNKGVTNTA